MSYLPAEASSHEKKNQYTCSYRCAFFCYFFRNSGIIILNREFALFISQEGL